MSHAIGRAHVPHSAVTGTIYTADHMSDATIDLFRALSAPTAALPAIPQHTATCPPWCPGGCWDDIDKASLHERIIANVHGREYGVSGEDMHNQVKLEAYDGDGATEPTTIMLSVLPAGRGRVADMSVLDGMDTVLVRSIAASAMSGGYGGEQVCYTADEAEQLGKALIEAATLARQARA